MPRPRPRAYSASIVAPRAASNTPAASAALGRLLASATSATPVTTKASAVLNDIGFWLPKCKTAVARTNQAAITARPTATHSRPPARVIASGTRSLRDAECQPGRQARPEADAPGAGRTSSASWIRIALHPPPEPVTARGSTPGGASTAVTVP